MKKFFRKVKKFLCGRYQKLSGTYGKKRAFVMGSAYVLYRIFLMPVIKFLKKEIKNPKANRIVLETKPDYADNGRVISEYMVEN